MTIVITKADITTLAVDAIANAANDRLWMGGGVAGAIRRRGGATIEREAIAQGPIPVGSAVATSAGKLKAKWVIHGAVMGQDLKTNAELVEWTTRAVIQTADEIGARTLALPAFGTGVGGLSFRECAEAMQRAIQYTPYELDVITIALPNAEAVAVFEEAFGLGRGSR